MRHPHEIEKACCPPLKLHNLPFGYATHNPIRSLTLCIISDYLPFHNMNVPAQNIDMNCRLPSAIHRLNCLLLIMIWMAPVSIIPKSDGTRGKTIWRSTLHIWPIPCSIFSSGRHMRSIHQHHPCQCRFDSSLVMHTLNAHTHARALHHRHNALRRRQPIIRPLRIPPQQPASLTDDIVFVGIKTMAKSQRQRS